MKISRRLLARNFVFLVCLCCSCFGVIHGIQASPAHSPKQQDEDFLVLPGKIGTRGGRLVASLRSEPKVLNPVTALDLASKEVNALLFADLIHINPATQRTEPALAKSWKVSPDGTRYTLELRHGLRFSDGKPFDADDVLFSFKVYLDEKVHSPQRDLLLVNGKPIQVRKLGAYQVLFELPEPYAAAERIFDSVSILPRHLLEQAYQKGEITQVWNQSTNPENIAGLGPFRLKADVPGQQIVLERNPYYWKKDTANTRLPYLDELIFLVIPAPDAGVLRFQAGDIDLIDNLSAENFAVLAQDQSAKHYHVLDLGPGFEYDFLFFNLNDLSSKKLPAIQQKQEWFRRDEFRQAISAAIDREAIVHLVYQNHATPLWGNVTPSNKFWIDTALRHPPQSFEKAMSLLRSIGFSRKNGPLLDAHGVPVEFSILVNATNPRQIKMATIIQDDLKHIGITVQVTALEYGSLAARVNESFDYEASIFGLVSPDADPNPEINVWTSSGGTHLWAFAETKPLTAWQSELDRLMLLQTTVLDYQKRKKIYDQVQEIVAQHDPVICLVNPNVLVGVKDRVEGVRPVVMQHHLLWNAEQIFRAKSQTKPQ